MIAYRNDLTYRNNQFYRPRGGVYQKPALCNSVSVGVFSAAAVDSGCGIGWGALTAISTRSASAWARALPAELSSAMAWGKAYAVDVEAAGVWSTAASCEAVLWTGWLAASHINSSAKSLWAKAVATDEVLAESSWHKTYRADAAAKSNWIAISHRYVSEFYRNPHPYQNWQKWNMPAYKLTLDPVAPFLWGGASPKKGAASVPWGGGFGVWGVDTPLEWTSDTSPIPDKEPPPSPEIREVYDDMATDLTVTDVSTGTPLAIEGVTMSLDIDSFAWSFSGAALNRSSLDLAMPGKTIKVATMGYEWVFLIGSYAKTGGFAAEWRLQGASVSRSLDAPWASRDTHTESSATSWRQALESLLPGGWIVNYEKSTDYPLPAGAWSYSDKTPREAISELLEAVGAVVVPGMSGTVLNIQPRHKYAPWEYWLETTEPDAILHEAMVLAESGEYRPGATNNGQVVSGTNRHGVIVEAVRSGTDGQPFASDFYHDLVTDVAAATQKAKSTAAASGDKMLVTLETVITDEQASPGVIVPGMLVEVQEHGGAWRGTCLFVRISGAGLPEITQTVIIERDEEYSDARDD